MKLQRLKLTQVNNVELRQEEMKHLIGASACGCGCKWFFYNLHKCECQLVCRLFSVWWWQ